MKYSLPLSLAVAASFCSLQQAQAQIIDPARDRGQFSTVPLALSVSEATRSTGVDDHVLYKERGDQVLPPEPWTQPAMPLDAPDYRLHKLFPNHHQTIELASMSSGNALIPTDQGLIDFASGPNNWAALMVSIKNSGNLPPVGQNAWLDLRRAGQLGSRTTAGADLITHFFAGSTGLNSSIAGNTFVSQTAEQIGFAGATVDDDIDGLDVGIGAIRANLNANSSVLFFPNGSGSFYFTVTKAWADSTSSLFAYNPHGAGTPDRVRTPNSATVYCMHWNANTLKWGAPEVYVDYSHLGLSAQDEIDALDVDPAVQSSAIPRFPRIAFSTQPRAGHSQLLVYEADNQQATIGTVYPLLSSANTPAMSGAFGLRDPDGNDEGDDIDVICYYDPEAGKFDDFVGIPYGLGDSNSTGTGLQLSVFRQHPDDFGFGLTGELQIPGSGGGMGVQIPWVYVEYSLDYDFSGAANPPSPTWQPLVNGQIEMSPLAIGAVATSFEEYLILPDQDTPLNVTFRARVMASKHSSTELGQSWISVIQY